MKTLVLTLFIALLSQSTTLHAQRQWAVSDSAAYPLGGDTTLIASRKQLYRSVGGTTTLLRDFTNANDPDQFIRDVDAWSSTEFHVVVGSRYIGGNTMLYHSIDGGASWAVDERFFDATEDASINQMAIIGDTSYLFNGYYTSEVLRSFDHGETWERWFQSLIAHYYGIIPCGSTAYIYGMVGDAFAPSMWQVPDTLWDDTDTFFWSGCHNGGTPGCYYSLNNAYAFVVQHFDSIADALCAATTSIGTGAPDDPVLAWPNPASDVLHVEGIGPLLDVRITDFTGRVFTAAPQGGSISIAQLTAGSYLLQAFSVHGSHTMRFVKE